MGELGGLLDKLDKLVPDSLFTEDTLQIIKDLRVLSSGQGKPRFLVEACFFSFFLFSPFNPLNLCRGQQADDCNASCASAAASVSQFAA